MKKLQIVGSFLFQKLHIFILKKSNSKFGRNKEGISCLKVLSHSVYMLDEISEISPFFNWA